MRERAGFDQYDAIFGHERREDSATEEPELAVVEEIREWNSAVKSRIRDFEDVTNRNPNRTCVDGSAIVYSDR